MNLLVQKSTHEHKELSSFEVINTGHDEGTKMRLKNSLIEILIKTL
jgi:hypothetical protein